jgi:LysM domain-containing protein
MITRILVGLVSGLLSCLMPLSLGAEEIELSPGHPERYVVKKGDTLWDISALFLKQPWLWPKIWRMNPQIEDPHLIYPGDVLTLAFEAGRPILQLGRGHGRSIRSPTVREYEHERAIPPIPLDAIWPFLSAPRVVGPEEMANAPYVVGSQDGHLVSDTSNRVYIRGVRDNRVNRYTVFRCGEVYRNPPAENYQDLRYGMSTGLSDRYSSTCIPGRGAGILGYEAIHVAEASIERLGDPATVVITEAKREVLVGDRLLPQTELEFPEFIPHAPTQAVTGHIISVMDAVSQVGPYQVVVLNRGSHAGLELGHVLAIYQSGIVVQDPIAAQVRAQHGFAHDRRSEYVELPHERIGELMVFRTFDKVSYALVMRASRAVHIYDSVQNP